MAKLIDLGQILTLVPFSKSTIRRKLKSGEFPPLVLLWGKHVWDERTKGPSKTGWPASYPLKTQDAA